MMKTIAILGLGFTLCFDVFANDASVYDRLWSHAMPYENGDATVVQRFAVVGRLQADAVYFDSSSGHHKDAVWRRFRIGGKPTVFRDYIAHVEADIDLNEWGSNASYKGLTDAYIGWLPSKAFNLKVGKQSAPFTLDGATSSTKLITLERSIVAENLWFTTEYFTGIAGLGSKDKWAYRLGVYSSSGDKEFGQFDAGAFGLASLGRKIREGVSVRVDYVYNNPDYSGDVGTADLEHVLCLVAKVEAGRAGLWTDFSFGDGIATQSGLWGLQLMPFYNFTDRWQAVFRYAVASSLDGPGVHMGRYPRKNEPGLAEEAHDFYLGVNCYLYGHKLKWQNGVEYNHALNMASTGDDYHGWGISSGLRISW